MSLKRLNINWYPGHMAKGFRLLKENLNLIDIVIEVCDARIPLSSRNEKLAELVDNKHKLVILNKADLANPLETRKWINYFNSRGEKCISISSLEMKKYKNKIFNICSEMLFDELEKSLQKGRVNRPIRLAFTGIPNCGKSTMINSLFSRNSMKTENRPGVTRSIHWLRSEDAKFECMDTPGLLWPKIEKDRSGIFLASLAAIREDILDITTIAYYMFIILFEIDAKSVIDFYRLKSPICKNFELNDFSIYEIENFELVFYELFEEASRNRGCIKKSNMVDVDRFARIFIKDLRLGNISRLTLEPFNSTKLKNIDKILK